MGAEWRGGVRVVVVTFGREGIFLSGHSGPSSLLEVSGEERSLGIVKENLWGVEVSLWEEGRPEKKQSDLVRGPELTWLQCGVLWQFVMVALGVGAGVRLGHVSVLVPRQNWHPCRIVTHRPVVHEDIRGISAGWAVSSFAVHTSCCPSSTVSSGVLGARAKAAGGGTAAVCCSMTESPALTTGYICQLHI